MHKITPWISYGTMALGNRKVIILFARPKDHKESVKCSTTHEEFMKHKNKHEKVS
jgi:hypothetical protein